MKRIVIEPVEITVCDYCGRKLDEKTNVRCATCGKDMCKQHTSKHDDELCADCEGFIGSRVAYELGKKANG